MQMHVLYYVSVFGSSSAWRENVTGFKKVLEQLYGQVLSMIGNFVVVLVLISLIREVTFEVVVGFC